MMLPEIPNVTTIRKGIIRILGQNPGPFTLQGTNTYLIASEKSSLLFDTGEGRVEYLGLLESVLKSHPPVSDIILSHWHQDHVGGLPSVLKLIYKLQGAHALTTAHSHTAEDSFHNHSKFPKVWKFKSSTGSALECLDDQKPQEQLVKHDQEILNTLHDCTSNEQDTPPSKSSGDDQQLCEAKPRLNWLSDRQVFQLSANRKLQVLHTPGHTDDSICCLLCEEEEEEEEEGLERDDNRLERKSLQYPSAVLVGDTILGGSSTIFEDLVVYLNSLEKLLVLINSDHHPSSDSNITPSIPVPLYPAHGPLILNGSQSIRQFISHRLDREKQILEIFRLQNQNKSPTDSDYYLTAEKLVKLIYPTDLPEQVFPAAVNGINQHLRKLKHDGLIEQLEANSELWFLRREKKIY